jgi:hypothetical protein
MRGLTDNSVHSLKSEHTKLCSDLRERERKEEVGGGSETHYI